MLIKGARHWPRIRSGAPEAYLRTALYRRQTSWWRVRRHREVSTDVLPQAAA